MVGDIDANIERLRIQLRQMRYPALQQLDSLGLKAGRPLSLLPVIHFAMVNYSLSVSAFLSECGEELRSKSDLRFLEAVYRSLREHLGYIPALSVNQFFSPGFAERKVMLCQDILQIVRSKHEELNGGISSRGARTTAHRKGASSTVGEDVNDLQIHQDLGCDSRQRAWAQALPTASYVNLLEQELTLSSELLSPQKPPQPSRLDVSAAFSTASCTEEPLQVKAPSPPESVMQETLKQPPPATKEEVSDNSAADPLFSLLAEIRTALEKRFERLERRFEEHVEAASARVTLLEGEMRILSAKLGQVQEAVRAVQCSPAPRVDSERADAIQSFAHAISTPQDASLRRFDACPELSRPQKPNVFPFHRPEVVGVPSYDTGQFLQHDPIFESSTSKDSVAFPSCSSHVRTTTDSARQIDNDSIEQHINSGSEARDLIEKLSVKFRNTKELLQRAQEKVQGTNTFFEHGLQELHRSSQPEGLLGQTGSILQKNRTDW